MVASDDRDKSSVSRRSFLRGGAVATGAVATTIIPMLPADASAAPEATAVDARRSTVELKVNGVAYRADVANNTTLLQLLREELKLTGAKAGCDRLQCGACTVIVDGRSVYACTVLAVEAGGADVATIEGLARGETLHPIQQGFVEHSGFQCGFCTSGQIMSAKALLDKNPSPTEDDVRRGLSGNLCRCSAYKRILQSVMTASRLMRA